MRVADYIVRFLERAGVEHVFTVYGGAIAPLGDALVKAGMRFVCTHHEQAAAMAAEGYARRREGVGAVFVTSGPGGTNAITGLVGCWTDHVPVMFFSGQSFSKQTIGDTGVRQIGVQEIDIINGVRPWTKYAEMVTDPKEIPDQLSRAHSFAVRGRPGPVWLDIPADVLSAQCR
jgi:acetolactate synthase-1/2/3 large subunit